MDKIEEVIKRLDKMPLMHGDYQLDLILAQDVLNILRELSSKPQPDWQNEGPTKTVSRFDEPDWTDLKANSISEVEG